MCVGFAKVRDCVGFERLELEISIHQQPRAELEFYGGNELYNIMLKAGFGGRKGTAGGYFHSMGMGL